MRRGWIAVAGVGGLLAVVGAAMGEHLVGGDAVAAGFARIAAEFAFFHALALLSLAAIAGRPELEAMPWASRLIGWAGTLFILGTVLFSGSLWSLALAGLRLPAATPAGGLCLMAGWALVIGAGLAAGRTPRS